MNKTARVAFFLTLFGGGPLLAATFVVDTSGDTFDSNDGKTSLREALVAANAAPGKDFIVMSDSLEAGITLVIGSLIITEEVDIDGNYFPPPIIGKENEPSKILPFPAPIEVSGDNKFGVLAIFDGPGSIEIRNIVFSNGFNETDDGGGIDIRVPRTVTLQNVTVRNCRTNHDGGGVSSKGADLAMISCRVTGNAAGIANNNGGGVYALGGEVSLIGCDVDGNISGGGGGLFLPNVQAELIDTDLTGNRSYVGSGGGISIFGAALLSVTRGEIVANRATIGGGIASFNSTHLFDALIADNTAEQGGGGYWGTEDLTATGTDFIRNIALGTELDDGGGGLKNLGTATLRDCTIESNVSKANYFFAPGFASGGGGILNQRTMTLTDSVVVRNETPNGGMGAGILSTLNSTSEFDGVTILDNRSASYGGGIACVRGRVAMIGGTISDNTSLDWGGGIFNSGVFEATETLVTRNVSDASPFVTFGGGGIFSFGNLFLQDVSVVANSAPNPMAVGGGILVNGLGSSTKISGGIISGNEAGSFGGGIMVESQGQAILTGVEVFSNETSSSGGGIGVDTEGEVHVNGGVIFDNTSPSGGGVSALGAGVFRATDSDFHSNVAVATDPGQGGGGAFLCEGGTVGLYRVNVFDNTAEAGGGGGILNRGILSVTDSSVFRNASIGLSSGGGGIHNLNGGQATLLRAQLFENRSSRGGGGIDNSGQFTVLASTLSGNTAQVHGGAISSESGVVELFNTTLSGNRSEPGNGGAIHVEKVGVVHLLHTTISNNHAGTSGGGAHVTGGILRMGNSILAGNSAGVNSPDLFGNLTSLDFNLIGNTSNGSLSGPLVNSLLNVDPIMGPLADNGGPTSTHHLLTGSGAIDGGSIGLTATAVLPVDQRGFQRVANIGLIPDTGGGVDMGAVEVIGVAASDGSANEGAGALQFSVTLSHLPPPGETVMVEVSTFDLPGGAIAGEDYEPVAGKVLTFTSAGPSLEPVAVVLNDDSEFESNELFDLRITRATAATIIDATAVGIVFNDDIMPTNTPVPSQTPTPSFTPEPLATATNTRDYDVRPLPVVDGIIDALDLIEWYTRIGDDGLENGALFDFARFWNPE